MVNRVDHSGSVSVKDLAVQFDVSVETMRRDLRVLEEKGLLRRQHGSALSLVGDEVGLAFGQRADEQASEKNAIAQKATSLVRAGDAIMLDASSSSWYLAKVLPDMKLTVITNSMRVAFELVSRRKIKTLTIGGEYSEKYGAFLGPLATSQVGNFCADILFFSCTGFQEESGVWESNEANAAIKQSMLRSAERSVLLCDSSKVGKSGLIRLCKTDDLSRVISE
ncbi:hypothetical protein GZ77_25750 [Endozoicomonas montiporae]|uniref:HTH deoR-type domain-containing protein n=1 Tax=Endozoicomonas montiporae TaxID=1027273 RepID=A0A081MZ76_9GAMM|nr:hypothetical protein GZ77_25750 [Endozoicomonas montiporae]